ncbi:hypothetical protein V6Z11_A04G090500 [Gossypium hirsutum]
MPPRRVNVRTSAQEDGTSFSPPVSQHRVNILDKGVEPLMEDIIRAFQLIAGANPAPALVNRGLSLERLRKLGCKEFSGVKGTDPTVAEYWLEGVERILKQMSYSNEEKLGCVLSLLDSKAHRWWIAIRRGIVIDRLTWSYFFEVFKRKFMGK